MQRRTWRVRERGVGLCRCGWSYSGRGQVWVELQWAWAGVGGAGVSGAAVGGVVFSVGGVLSRRYERSGAPVLSAIQNSTLTSSERRRLAETRVARSRSCHGGSDGACHRKEGWGAEGWGDSGERGGGLRRTRDEAEGCAAIREIEGGARGGGGGPNAGFGGGHHLTPEREEGARDVVELQIDDARREEPGDLEEVDALARVAPLGADARLPPERSTTGREGGGRG